MLAPPCMTFNVESASRIIQSRYPNIRPKTLAQALCWRPAKNNHMIYLFLTVHDTGGVIHDIHHEHNFVPTEAVGFDPFFYFRAAQVDTAEAYIERVLPKVARACLTRDVARACLTRDETSSRYHGEDVYVEEVFTLARIILYWKPRVRFLAATLSTTPKMTLNVSSVLTFMGNMQKPLALGTPPRSRL